VGARRGWCYGCSPRPSGWQVPTPPSDEGGAQKSIFTIGEGRRHCRCATKCYRNSGRQTRANKKRRSRPARVARRSIKEDPWAWGKKRRSSRARVSIKLSAPVKIEVIYLEEKSVMSGGQDSFPARSRGSALVGQRRQGVEGRQKTRTRSRGVNPPRKHTRSRPLDQSAKGSDSGAVWGKTEKGLEKAWCPALLNRP